MAEDDLELVAPGPEVEDGLALDDAAPEVVLLAEEDPPPLGRSWSFDMGDERFRRHGGRPREIRGLATLVQWIDKYLHTQRGALPIHPPWFGMTDPYGIFGQPMRELSSTDLLRDMEGMANHPHIAEVVDARLSYDELDEVAFLEVDVLTDPPTEDVDVLKLRYSLEV
jgi:hypothetical protein